MSRSERICQALQVAHDSQMAREAAEAASGARRQLATYRDRLDRLVRDLQARPPTFVMTCARGSSDHAATYGKYLLETTIGHVVASVGPSIASVYRRAPVALEGSLLIVVSQSGRSPDLRQLTRAVRSGGARVLGLINDEASPLAAECDAVIPLCAGEERSVAATKSFLLAGLAFLGLAAEWTGDPRLREAVRQAPDAFAAACAIDWSPALASLATATSLYVLARGLGLGAAQELALKLKETCRLHAEAFSFAELRHGPIALVGAGFPVLALGQEDETAPAVRDEITHLLGLGAAVRSTVERAGAELLPTVPGVPSVLAPLCQVQSCYLAIPRLAEARGLDADAPVNLRKVTLTV